MWDSFMADKHNIEESIKFRPDYTWPEEGSTRNCPRCNNPMQLQENLRDFYGKPWWCHSCQWQFSEEDLKE